MTGTLNLKECSDMAYRYTNTDKWADEWFSGLKPLAKLLFMYLCDQCDIAGFIEINEKKICFDTGLDKQGMAKAMKEISGRLVKSGDGRFLYITNFIKHQKNLPLNPNNSAHRGIIARLEHNLELFGCQAVEDFLKRGFKGASKGLQSPIGNGNGNGNGKLGDTGKGVHGGKPQEPSDWRDSFDAYLSECHKAVESVLQDGEFITQQQRFHPGIDIELSIEKAVADFWGTEAGWKHKKASRTARIDWPATFRNALNLRSNQVTEQQTRPWGYRIPV